MTIVRVETGHAYDVVIEAGVLARAAEWLAPRAKNGRMIVVVDAHVVDPHGTRLKASLESVGIRIETIVIPSGESSKNWAQLAALTDRLLTLEIERGETIIALGGGVIGDLTGFAAAIVKRGCRFVQIPTTLLAQVDSSVGGKTAINTAAGKNLIGAFHQPDLVLIDPEVLDTLPPREVQAGYAEVVKYGLIDDPAFFDWCETNGAALLAGDMAAREYAIATSVAAKARIVAADERETTGTRALLNLGHTFGHALEAETGFSDRLLHGEGVAAGGYPTPPRAPARARIVPADERETTGTRALLNLGHTFGHALEAETGFSDRLLHGEGVAAGMALAFRFSVARGLCERADADRVTAHLATVGLPTGARPATNADGATLAAHMAHDKKREGGAVPLLLARGIGSTFLARGIDLAEVAAFLDSDAG